MVGPLRGGGGKTPLTTKQTTTLFSSKEKFAKKNMNHQGLGGGVTKTLVVQPLIKLLFFLCFFPLVLTIKN